MGLKLLLLVVLVAVVWFTWRGRSRSRSHASDRHASARPKAGQDVRASSEAVDMVACSHCRVHLPRDEASWDEAGVPYCSPAHRQAGPGGR
jgi:uncharacterized protein